MNINVTPPMRASELGHRKDISMTSMHLSPTLLMPPESNAGWCWAWSGEQIALARQPEAFARQA